MTNPLDNLKEANKNVADAEATLEEMNRIHAEAVKNQKNLIKVAKANQKAWAEIVDRANELTAKK